jgi:hypothetical protein
MIQTIFGSPVVVLYSDNVKELFPDNVYKETIDHLMGIESKFVDHPYTRGGKICTTDLNFTMNSAKIEKLSTLLDFLKKTGLKYSYLFTNKPVTDLKFHNMWINFSFQGCEIKNHYDKYVDCDDKSLIILFYPKAPTGGANLVFIHDSIYGEWASDRSEKDLVKINIEEGYIVIIDNSVLHAVDVHMLTEPRMCIATEFKLTL